MWRSRLAFVVKLAGIVAIIAGVATFPTSIGSPMWSLSIFHYIQALGIFLPVGGGLLILGLVLLAIGRAISRDWLF
jgi:uncharacterized membrane protein YgdD (TMEM256/DUF423 family)